MASRQEKNDLADGLDIAGGRVSLALAPARISKFHVSAFCTDVGVPFGDAAEVVCGSVVVLACNHGSHINHTDVWWLIIRDP